MRTTSPKAPAPPSPSATPSHAQEGWGREGFGCAALTLRRRELRVILLVDRVDRTEERAALGCHGHDDLRRRALRAPLLVDRVEAGEGREAVVGLVCPRVRRVAQRLRDCAHSRTSVIYKLQQGRSSGERERTDEAGSCGALVSLEHLVVQGRELRRPDERRFVAATASTTARDSVKEPGLSDRRGAHVRSRVPPDSFVTGLSSLGRSERSARAEKPAGRRECTRRRA